MFPTLNLQWCQGGITQMKIMVKDAMYSKYVESIFKPFQLNLLLSSHLIKCFTRITMVNKKKVRFYFIKKMGIVVISTTV